MPGAPGKMYMGTRGFETWVPACSISPDFTRKNTASSGQYLNGGAYAIASKYGARNYQMTWGLHSRDELRPVADFAHHLFDTQDGTNLIYFLDPLSMDKNVLPPNFATPALTLEDAPGLFGPDNTPTAQATAANAFRYPARSAVYYCDGESTSIYIPIPPSYTAWVGAHGSATGAAGMRVTAANGQQDGDSTTLTMMDIGSELTNYSLPASPSVTGMTIDFPATGLLRNLAPNPSFESDVAGVYNVPGTGGAVGVPTRVAASSSYYGSWAARTTWTTATTAISGGMTEAIPVTGGLVYSFGGYARSSIAQTLQPFVTWHDAGGVYISQSTGANITTAANDFWTNAPQGVVQGVQAPSNAVQARFGLRATTGGANWSVGSWLEFDGIQANEGTTTQIFKDGNSSGWQWNGATNDSTSRQTPDQLLLTGMVVQILPNGIQPQDGNFVSGQGNGGCEFASYPTETPYNKALDLVAMSGVLLETGPWI